MKKLFITEKPSVAQQFASVLGVKRTSKTDGYIEDNDLLLPGVWDIWFLCYIRMHMERSIRSGI